jgi:hypothetical protein
MFTASQPIASRACGISLWKIVRATPFTRPSYLFSPALKISWRASNQDPSG